MMTNRVPHIYHNTIYAKKLFEVVEDKHIRIRAMYKELELFNDLMNSYGALLDLLGNNLKVARNGRSDEEYRRLIFFESNSLQFMGSVEEIITILSTIFDKDINDFSIDEFSGKIRLIIPNDLSKEKVFNYLKKVKSAGVGLNIDFEIYIEDFLISELEEKTLEELENIKLARR